MSQNNNKKSLTYKDAGVDIDEGDALVDDIVPSIKKTHRKEVMSNLGGYAGLFALDLKKYPEPILVSTTDGVGTKLKLAFEMNKFDTIGQDLVAMCVNDLICCGAEPLFFLDYFATGHLSKEVGAIVIRGIAEALAPIHCSLTGGETAEMPGMYAKGEFDLAGFAVGVVNKDRVIDGSSIKAGDALLGLTSSGVHSNGYSLVRKIIETQKVEITRDLCGFDKPIGEVLLTPTRIYVNEVLSLIKQFDIRGIAHITGGGLVENLPRIFSQNTCAVLDKTKIKTPTIFKWLQEKGNVPEDEMWRVFNMGVGLVVVASQKQKNDIIKHLEKMNCTAFEIGTMVEKKTGQKEVTFL
ncbi:MAG TPA: phosphoribosylformylglycinamidine cyclo-ligase [Deltaproteobacteria bacterium]|nr:MAG: phosphoribosylformylglycinamidine cyclo-ligase [Deltaproteobacteria bacterium GWA2_45_12]HBF12413.1 phosphoribosylformylglycinamidine cyclo-ligase [Deltaproteobacteria bacterium]